MIKIPIHPLSFVLSALFTTFFAFTLISATTLTSNIYITPSSAHAQIYGEIPCPSDKGCYDLQKIAITTNAEYLQIFNMQSLTFSLAALPSGELYTTSDNVTAITEVFDGANNLQYQLVPASPSFPSATAALNTTHIIVNATILFSQVPKFSGTIVNEYNAQLTLTFGIDDVTLITQSLRICNPVNQNKITAHAKNTAEISVLSTSHEVKRSFQYLIHIPSLWNPDSPSIHKVALTLYGPWVYNAITPESSCLVNTYNISSDALKLSSNTHSDPHFGSSFDITKKEWFKTLEIDLKNFVQPGVNAQTNKLFPNTAPISIRCSHVTFSPNVDLKHLNDDEINLQYVNPYSGAISIDFFTIRSGSMIVSQTLLTQNIPVGKFLSTPLILSRNFYLNNSLYLFYFLQYPQTINTGSIVYDYDDFFTVQWSNINISSISTSVYSPYYTEYDDPPQTLEHISAQFEEYFNQTFHQTQPSYGSTPSSSSTFYSSTIYHPITTIVNKNHITEALLPLERPFPPNSLTHRIPHLYIIAYECTLAPTENPPHIPSTTALFTTSTTLLQEDRLHPITLPLSTVTPLHSSVVSGPSTLIASHYHLSLRLSQIEFPLMEHFPTITHEDGLAEPDPWSNQRFIISLDLPRSSEGFIGDFTQCQLSVLSASTQPDIPPIWTIYYNITGYTYNTDERNPYLKEVEHHMAYNMDNDFFYTQFYTNETYLMQTVLTPAIFKPFNASSSKSLAFSPHHLEFYLTSSNNYPIHDQSSLQIDCSLGHIDHNWPDLYPTEKFIISTIQIEPRAQKNISNSIVTYRSTIVSFVPHEIGDQNDVYKALVIASVLCAIAIFLTTWVILHYLQCCSDERERLRHRVPKNKINNSVPLPGADIDALIADESSLSIEQERRVQQGYNTIKPNQYHAQLFRFHNQIQSQLHNYDQIHCPSREFLHSSSDYQPMFE